MRKGVGIFLLLALAAVGCSHDKLDTADKPCFPPCFPWETCTGGVCVAEELDPGWQSSLAIAPVALPDATVGTSYQQALTAAGGVLPVSFSLQAGALPPGLQLDAEGLLFGTPTVAGVFDFGVRAVDDSPDSRLGTAVLSLRVLPATLAAWSGSLPDAVVGEVYAASLSASGGTAPYTFATTGGLPAPGLQLAPDGAVFGTPLQAGSFAVQFEVIDAASPAQTARSEATLTVHAALRIAPATLPAATEGEVYGARLLGVGGTAPYAFELVQGPPPAGLALDASGLIGGVPEQRGLYDVLLRVRDAASREALQPFALTVLPPAPVLSAATLPEAMVGHAYRATLSASGGTPPYRFEPHAGSLPSGLWLTADGVLEGTPLAAGAFDFTLRVLDGAGRGAIATFGLAVLEQLQLVNQPAPGRIFDPYEAWLTAAGGRAPYRFQLASGNLPAGLQLSDDGRISGVPTEPGLALFEVALSDGSAPAWTTVAPVQLEIADRLRFLTETLPDGVLAVPYAAAVQAAGGVEPYSFRLVAGSMLPPGLRLADDGAIDGTPLAAGSSTFTLELRDSANPPEIVHADLTIGISPDGIGRPLVIVTEALEPGAINQPYQAQIDVAGGSPPYLVSLAFGTVLPTGLTLGPAGEISGTPLHAGTYRLIVQADDSSVPEQVAVRGFTLTILPESGEPLALLTDRLPEAFYGVPYQAPLEAAGGTPPYRFGVTGASRLPSGLYLDAAGRLQGTPLASGVFTFTAAVWDASAPYQMATAALTLVVDSDLVGGGLFVVTTALRKAKLTVPYAQVLTAAGGSGAYSWSLVWGMLPPGIRLDSGGSVAGIAEAQGIFPFTVEVEDTSTGVTTQANLILTAMATGSAGMRISTPGFPDATVGEWYSRSLHVNGGQAPYDYTIEGASPGLALNVETTTRRGALEGIPEVSGLFRPVLTAFDAVGESRTFYGLLSVYPDPLGLVFSTSMLPDGKVGVSYALQLGASGGTAPYSFELAYGTRLPAGLVLDASGLLHGVPTAAETLAVVVRVTDADGRRAETQFSIETQP